MKPKGLNENDEGLLEYLEDIIGTSGLKIPIELAEKQYDELNEIRDDKLAHLKLIQKETKTLEGQSCEAIKYIESENKIVRMQNQMVQRQIRDAHDKLVEVEKQKVELEAKVESDKFNQSGLAKEVADLEIEVDECQTEHDVYYI